MNKIIKTRKVTERFFSIDTKDDILDIIDNISMNTQEGDYWRWEIIKVLARNREGNLSTQKAQNAIIDLAKFMPDLSLVQAHIDEFRVDRGENNE